MWETGRDVEAGRGPSAWLPDGTALAVRAATHESVCVEVPPGAELRAGTSVEVRLGDSQQLAGPFAATVARIDPPSTRPRFALLAVHPMPPERRRQLATVLLRWPAAARRREPERMGLDARSLRDPGQVAALLSAIASEGQPGLVRGLPPGSYTGARVRAAEFDVTDDLPMHWRVAGGLPPTPFVIELGAGDFTYHLAVLRARADGDHLATGVPDEVLRVPCGRAWLYPIAAGETAVVDAAGRMVRPLRRLGDRRLAFVADHRDGARPETPLPVRVSIDGFTFEGTATFEAIRPSPTDDELLHVARFEPAGTADAARWRLARERVEHPHTRRAGTWAGNLWELYDKSGYFQLSGKTSAHFTPLRNAFALATRRLDTAPQIGCHVVWPTRERIEAALSVLFVYEGTAMVYQVARRRDEGAPVGGRQMLRDVNLHAFDHLRQDPDFDWTLVYVQEGGARWSHLAYQTFTESQLATGLACVVRFRAMEATVTTPAVARGQAGFTVGLPTAEERARFLAALPRMRQQPYLESLDLVPERFDLAGVRGRWSGAGFSRERTLLVARRAGRALAAAVLESAQDALHLFGLLDCVRFYPFGPGGEEAFAALIEGARAWFRGRGKSSFVCFFEAESFPHASQPGLTDLGAANLMAFPRLLLPDFLEHLYVITAPRRRGH